MIQNFVENVLVGNAGALAARKNSRFRLPSLWKKTRLSTLPETNIAPPRKPSQKGKVVFQPIHFSSPILVSESTVTFFCAELPHRSFVIEHPHLSVPQSPPKILSGVFVGGCFGEPKKWWETWQNTPWTLMSDMAIIKDQELLTHHTRHFGDINYGVHWHLSFWVGRSFDKMDDFPILPRIMCQRYFSSITNKAS